MVLLSITGLEKQDREVLNLDYISYDFDLKDIVKRAIDKIRG